MNKDAEETFISQYMAQNRKGNSVSEGTAPPKPYENVGKERGNSGCAERYKVKN